MPSNKKASVDAEAFLYLACSERLARRIASLPLNFPEPRTRVNGKNRCQAVRPSFR
jgi:hypothetical protein